MLVDTNSDYYMEMFLEFEAVLQKFKEFITDEKLPLHVRVEAFMNMPKGMLPSDTSSSGFSNEVNDIVCRILGKNPHEDEVCMYDDFYCDRYATLMYADVMYRMTEAVLENDEEFCKQTNGMSTAYIIAEHELLSELAEAILAEGEAGFTYGW